MLKQFSGLFLALTLAGLVGCGGLPTTLRTMDADRMAVATFGEHGANIMLGFEQGLSTQATVHRWVPADIVRYDVVLTAENAAQVYEELSVHPVAKDATGVRFKGLQFGKRYRVHVRIMGVEGGVPAPGQGLLVLNQNSQNLPGIGYVAYDFTADQDIESEQAGTVALRFDSVAFNGKGDLTLNPPVEGGYESEPVPSAEIVPND